MALNDTWAVTALLIIALHINDLEANANSWKRKSMNASYTAGYIRALEDVREQIRSMK